MIREQMQVGAGLPNAKELGQYRWKLIEKLLHGTSRGDEREEQVSHKKKKKRQKQRKRKRESVCVCVCKCVCGEGK